MYQLEIKHEIKLINQNRKPTITTTYVNFDFMDDAKKYVDNFIQEFKNQIGNDSIKDVFENTSFENQNVCLKSIQIDQNEVNQTFNFKIELKI